MLLLLSNFILNYILIVLLLLLVINYIIGKVQNYIFIYLKILMNLIIFFSLYVYLVSNFNFFIVFSHSSLLDSIFFKFIEFWSTSKGVLIIGFFFLFYLYYNCYFFLKGINSYLIKKIFKLFNIFMFVNLFFISFFRNPYLFCNYLVLEGSGLNYLLQDVLLSIHPPIIFFSMCGLHILFLGFFIHINFYENFFLYNQKILKKVILSCLGILTFGIFLGSWWAYYELGWGGWWFWDPVENLSFIIWLSFVLLLHLLKFRLFLFYSIFILFANFLLILNGMLLRNNFFVSVHNFISNDSINIILFFILFFFLLSYFILKKYLSKQFFKLNFALKLILFYFCCIIFLTYFKWISFSFEFFNYLTFCFVFIVFFYFLFYFLKKITILKFKYFFFNAFIIFNVIGLFYSFIYLNIVLFFFFNKKKNILVHFFLFLSFFVVCFYTLNSFEYLTSLGFFKLFVLKDLKFLLLGWNYIYYKNYDSLSICLFVLDSKHNLLDIVYLVKNFFFDSMSISNKSLVISSFFLDLIFNINYINNFDINILIIFNYYISVIWIMFFFFSFFLVKKIKLLIKSNIWKNKIFLKQVAKREMLLDFNFLNIIIHQYSNFIKKSMTNNINFIIIDIFKNLFLFNKEANKNIYFYFLLKHCYYITSWVSGIFQNRNFFFKKFYNYNFYFLKNNKNLFNVVENDSNDLLLLLSYKNSNVLRLLKDFCFDNKLNYSYMNRKKIFLGLLNNHNKYNVFNTEHKIIEYPIVEFDNSKKNFLKFKYIMLKNLLYYNIFFNYGSFVSKIMCKYMIFFKKKKRNYLSNKVILKKTLLLYKLYIYFLRIMLIKYNNVILVGN